MASSANTSANTTVNRFWGATTLIAGTTIGAGVLGLPSMTIEAGVIPSSIGLILAWCYALSTGLLLAEIHLRTLEQNQAPNHQTSVGLISLIAPVFGASPIGQIIRTIAAIAYGFLHYALLIAYIAQGGAILNPLIKVSAEVILVMENLTPPPELGSIVFVTILGSLLYLGRSQLIDRVNAIFIAVILTSFLGLINTMAPQISGDRLFDQHWAALPAAFPVMLVAIFFQNVIPVVTTQLESNIKQIRRAIFLGSAFPLVLFLLWNTSVLLTVQEGSNPLDFIHSNVWVSIFSEFAIATSFIGFVYGLLNFFNDIFFIAPGDIEINPSLKRSLYLLILTPAIVIAILNPNIFLSALDWAGTFCISILGGLLPALMAWLQRREFQGSSRVPALVPGGQWSLGLIGAIGLLVLFRVGS